jgi:hypothetical protein
MYRKINKLNEEHGNDGCKSLFKIALEFLYNDRDAQTQT